MSDLVRQLPYDHPHRYDLTEFGGPKLWTPSDITTKFWYDAYDEDTIIDSGGSVSQWNDKSGNGFHLTQSNGTNQPDTGASIGGLNALNFNGSNHYLDRSSITATQPLNVFMVLKPDVAPGTSKFIADGISGRIAISITSGDKFGLFAGSTASGLTTVVGGTKYLLVGRVNGASSQQWLNGTDDTSTTNSGGQNLDGITVGAKNGGALHYDGKIGEYLAFEGNLTDATRIIIEGYLAHKWGLTDNLPYDHKFKYFPPNSDGEPVKVVWTPEQITTKSWYDAADSNTVTESGGFISLWNDKGSIAEDAFQVVGTKQPTYVLAEQNGLNIVRFDGSDTLEHLYSTGSNEEYSIFAVVSAGTHSGFKGIYSSDDNTPDGVMLLANGSTDKWGTFETTDGWQPADSDIDNTGWKMLAMVCDPGLNSGTFYLDSIADGTFLSTEGQGLGHIGGAPGQDFTGDIGEIILVPSSTPLSVRQKLFGYLAHKWGLTSSLPGSDPYKTIPPTI